MKRSFILIVMTLTATLLLGCVAPAEEFADTWRANGATEQEVDRMNRVIHGTSICPWGESSGNPLAVGDRGQSFGLAQIHWPAHPRWLTAEGVDREDLLRPAVNAEMAWRIYKGHNGWRNWTCAERSWGIRG